MYVGEIKPGEEKNLKVEVGGTEDFDIVPALARRDLYPLYARLCFEQKLKEYCGIFIRLYLDYINTER